MNLQSRRALLKQFAPQYRAASSAHKRMLLDAFVQATGYHRRYVATGWTECLPLLYRNQETVLAAL